MTEPVLILKERVKLDERLFPVEDRMGVRPFLTDTVMSLKGINGTVGVKTALLPLIFQEPAVAGVTVGVPEAGERGCEKVISMGANGLTPTEPAVGLADKTYNLLPVTFGKLPF